MSSRLTSGDPSEVLAGLPALEASPDADTLGWSRDQSAHRTRERFARGRAVVGGSLRVQSGQVVAASRVGGCIEVGQEYAAVGRDWAELPVLG